MELHEVICAGVRFCGDVVFEGPVSNLLLMLCISKPSKLTGLPC